jgi:hypothetical protein
MAVIDLMSLVDQRLEDITKQNPSMSAEELYFEGDHGLWCLITIRSGQGRTIEHNFVEGEESWKRPDAVLEYNQAAMEMIKVIVIVPDTALPDVMALVRNYDGQDVVVTDYSAMGLIPLPLAY